MGKLYRSVQGSLPRERLGRLIYDVSGEIYEFGDDHVLKLVHARTPAAAARQVERLRLVQQRNSPVLVALREVGHVGPVVYQVMDRMTPARASTKTVHRLYESLKVDGLVHYDAQSQNVMKDSHGNLRLIDLDGVRPWP